MAHLYTHTHTHTPLVYFTLAVLRIRSASSDVFMAKERDCSAGMETVLTAHRESYQCPVSPAAVLQAEHGSSHRFPADAPLTILS